MEPQPDTFRHPSVRCAIHFKTQLLWTRLNYPIYTKLSLNITREVCLYLNDSFIVPCVLGDSLKVFFLDGRPTVTTTLSREFTTAAVPCLINQKTLMYVGHFSPYSEQVFTVDLCTFAVTEVQPMIVARGWPGVILFEGFVYVFGGNNPMLSSVEKFDLQYGKWSELPNMNRARYSFTPCLYKNEIYLGDLMDPEKAIEAFSPHSETYRMLKIKLPDYTRHSVAFVIDGVYYNINLDFKVAKWTIDSDDSEFSISLATDYDAKDKPYCGSPPIVLGHCVYFANYIEGILSIFDLKTLAFSRRVE